VSGVAEDSLSTAAIEQRVKSVLAKKLNKPSSAISLEDDLLFDLGLDSLSLAELVVRVEEIAGVRIRGDDLFDATTLGDLVDLVTKRSQEPDAPAGPPLHPR